MSKQDRKPSMIGITSFWLINVRFLGDLSNTYINDQLLGDMHVSETSVDGRVIHANFYPKGSMGFGAVVWPEWEYVMGETTHPAVPMRLLLRKAIVDFIEPMGISHLTKDTQWRVEADEFLREVVPLVFGERETVFRPGSRGAP